jgi:hypothetical protein
MTYTYHCKTCDTHWEENLTVATRDLPCTIPCKNCQSINSVVRTFTMAPRISYDGAKTVLQRAGSGWNDVLTKVKKASGRQAKIETR